MRDQVSLPPPPRDCGPIAGPVDLFKAGAVLPATEPAPGPETDVNDPSIAFGLSGISDWSTQMPFIDIMKTARPWLGHRPDQWGAVSFDDLKSGGYLTAEGWPVAMPDGVTALEALILTDLPPSATALAGRYVVTWEGSGELSVVGRATDVTKDPDAIRFSFAPGSGSVAVSLTAISPTDPIRNIKVMREDQVELDQAGAIFNPDWLRVIRDARVIRFMDWMQTNGSPQTDWDERPRPGDFSYAMRGVPLEVMVDLANQIAADPWFTLPHKANDAYVRAFATQVRDTLDPRLVAHAEWSNEVWNFQFEQARWAEEQAEARWAIAPGGDGWMQFAGTRAAEVADIWSAVYGDEAPARLRRIVSTQTGWLGLETPLLEAPLRQEEGLPPPFRSFDAYAVTGYFGHEIGEEAFASRLHQWLAEGDAVARVTEDLRAGSFRALIEDILPYQADVAARHGLELMMYEGGTHIVGLGEVTGDDAITAFMTAYNYSPEIAALYDDLIRAWRGLGDRVPVGPFNAFVDVTAPTRWGSWGALRSLDDSNPRWDMLMAWNAKPMNDSGRDPETFADGRLIRAGVDGAPIVGTAGSDVMIGGPGDDTFVSMGGYDRIGGGAGHDRVVLQGTSKQWTMSGAGKALRLLGPDKLSVSLVDMEEVVFEDRSVPVGQ